MSSVNKLFSNWLKSRNHKLYEVNIPVLKFVNFISNFINKDNIKEYEWIYDEQFGKCDCIPPSGAYSDPYCKHFNKLIRIVKE